MTTIYSYSGSINIIFAIISGVIIVIGTVFIIFSIPLFKSTREWASEIKKSHGSEKAGRIFVYGILTVFYLAIVSFIIFLLIFFIKDVLFLYRINNNDYIEYSGECEIIKVDEEWYRGDQYGYSVEFTIGNDIFTKSNFLQPLSNQEVEELRSNNNIRVYCCYYGSQLYVIKITKKI